MRIDLRDEHRQRIGRIHVDPALRPTRVTVTGTGREVFLEWDIAIDDGGHVRRCVACGCPDLFREKVFPQVTGIVVVLAFALAVIGALGFATTPPMLVAMGIVFVLDVAILLFARRRLICYRCRTSYHGVSIARYHRPWDRATADLYPRIAAPVAERAGRAAAKPRRRAEMRKTRPTRPVA
ncbi:MAG: hypothetical protein GY715_10230 [Planctomycetes bacterium]|nr:hypothetical protein [Planctomycetota bacterium]